MSIIRDKEVSLATIVSDSNLIVEVECVDVFEEKVAIPSDDTKKPVAPFIKKGFIFHVKGTWKNTTGSPVDYMIRVPHENWKRFFSQYKEAHANGPSKSFSVNSYKTEVSSFKEAKVLFLHAFQGTYQLVAKNAFEQLNKKEEIEALIRMS